MKQTVTTVLLICSITSFAQNFSCLQFGPKNYFINGNNYVRGIRIDSIRTSGSDLIYFPYRTMRISNYLDETGTSTPVIDSSGASWLGKKVIEHADGTFLFDNLWDTVIIKSQSRTGDSWIFFNDTTRYSYTATVTSEGTMTVLGTVDSIKTITITADSADIAHPIDPVNNFQIILSKNNGFVQVFDLYTFPYHRPDTVRHIATYEYLYLRWFDYYLDVVLNNLGTCDLGVCFDNLPDTVNSIFRLFPFHNPRDTEIYNFAVGDVYESYFTVSGPSTYYQQYTLDSVFTKTITASNIFCTGSGYEEVISLTASGPVITIDTTYSDPGYTMGVDTNFLYSPYSMPEEAGSGIFLHYYPHDFPGTLSCDSPATYEIGGDAGLSGFGYNGTNTVPSYNSRTYTIGYGLSRLSQYIAISDLTYSQYYNYYLKNGTACGTFFPTYHDRSGVSSVNLNDAISIAPNPTNDHLAITAPGQFSESSIVSVYDMSARCVYHGAADLQKGASINTATWLNGLYIVVVEDNSGIVKKGKVVVER